MSPAEALMAARTAGIQISIDGDDLVLEASEEPPVAVVDLLTEHKVGILTILRSGEAAWSPEDGQTCSDDRAATAEFEGRIDHPCHAAIGSAPITTDSASGDITGSASGDIATSAAADITGSVPSIAAAATPALRRPQGDEWSMKDWQAFFDERVGIAEFDGGLPRPAAEARAVDCCVAEWLYRTAVISAPGACPICGDADRLNDPLLAIGIIGGRYWLHIGCVKVWCTARRAAAVAALAAMGIRSPEGSST